MKYKLILNHPRDGHSEEIVDSFTWAMHLGHEKLRGFYDNSAQRYDDYGKFFRDNDVVGRVIPVFESPDAQQLYNLQESENNFMGVQCVRTIANFLERGRFAEAKATFSNEFGKVRAYPHIMAWLNDFFNLKLE